MLDHTSAGFAVERDVSMWDGWPPVTLARHVEDKAEHCDPKQSAFSAQVKEQWLLAFYERKNVLHAPAHAL